MYIRKKVTRQNTGDKEKNIEGQAALSKLYITVHDDVNSTQQPHKTASHIHIRACTILPYT
jgi:hypothetical protein